MDGDGNFPVGQKFYRLCSLTCTYFRVNTIVGFLEGPVSPDFWPLHHWGSQAAGREATVTNTEAPRADSPSSVILPAVTGGRASAFPAFSRAWLTLRVRFNARLVRAAQCVLPKSLIFHFLFDLNQNFCPHRGLFHP